MDENLAFRHKSFIKETQAHWGKSYQREISEFEAQEIIDNVYEFYSALRECKRLKLAREAGGSS